MKQYKNTQSGEIKFANRIIIKKDGIQIINPTHEMLINNGWEEYIPKPPSQEDIAIREQIAWQHKAEQDVVKMVINNFNNRTDVTNEEALAYPTIIYPWKNYIGKSLKVGQIVSHEEKLYRVRQELTQVIENQFPSINTAAIYEVIDKEHEGTLQDPIPYNGNMELFVNKYYIENDIIYLCTRDSGIPMYHPLSNLVGNYVIVV